MIECAPVSLKRARLNAKVGILSVSPLSDHLLKKSLPIGRLIEKIGHHLFEQVGRSFEKIARSDE